MRMEDGGADLQFSAYGLRGLTPSSTHISRKTLRGQKPFLLRISAIFAEMKQPDSSSSQFEADVAVSLTPRALQTR